MNLVNKDQLEILSTLRESVNEDKVGLEAELDKLQSQIRELSDKNKMQLEQINGLLLDKITLQSEGIGQREKMLQRERNFRYFKSHAILIISDFLLLCSDLRASVNGKDIPEDIKARLLNLHEENVALKEQLSTTQAKLTKAKTVSIIYFIICSSVLTSFGGIQFIKQQDKLLRAEYSRSNAGSPVRSLIRSSQCDLHSSRRAPLKMRAL